MREPHTHHLMTTPATDPLAQTRQDIDRIDAVLVALLSERTRLAMHAGRVKQATGQDVVVPAHEHAVLERVRGLARGPLDADAAARIFAQIIHETRTLQTQVRES